MSVWGFFGSGEVIQSLTVIQMFLITEVLCSVILHFSSAVFHLTAPAPAELFSVGKCTEDQHQANIL